MTVKKKIDKADDNSAVNFANLQASIFARIDTLKNPVRAPKKNK